MADYEYGACWEIPDKEERERCWLRVRKMIEDKFHEKVKNLDEKEWEELDEIWLNNLQPVLEEFYGGYHPKGKNAKEKRQRYSNFLYMYYITHPNREWDERYDQPLFGLAEDYAEENPDENPDKEE